MNQDTSNRLYYVKVHCCFMLAIKLTTLL